MNAVTYDRRDEDWEPLEDDQDEGRMPRRPRRKFFNKGTAALAAIVTCAAGFYAGVRVEKGQLSNSSSSGGSLASALASLRSRAGTGAAGSGSAAGSSGSGSSGSGRTGAGARAGGFGALPGGGFAGGGLGGGSASFGTISTVKGGSIYVTDSTGNVVKVQLSSATKLTKSLGVRRASLHPGDTVVIRGLKNSNGTLTATTVSDSGNSSAGSGSGSGSSGSSGSGGGSALSSLFSSGGSGG